VRTLSPTIVALLGAALAVAAWTAAAAPASPKIPPDIQGFETEVKRAADLLRIPGYAVAVVQDGKIVYRLNSGLADVERRTPVTDDTLFSLASVTKTFTAVMMMQYEAEKRVSLDDYLLSYPLDTSKITPSTIDANTRLRDVLSMTSGDLPARTFNYNGWRYSFLSGVFETVGKADPKIAYRRQVSARILQPLKLDHTIDGYPETLDPRTGPIAQGYALEGGASGAVLKSVPYDAGNYYPGPSAGLFSTIGDLAAYSAALDDDRLITRARYDEMTAPRPTTTGKASPYAFGWMTQSVGGVRLHWAYGEGRADSALLLRVPDRRLTLILLANAADHSSAARLHDGNVLWSPIATAFLKAFVLAPEERGGAIDYSADIGAIRRQVLASPDPLRFDELISQAAIRYYMASLLHEPTKPSADLLRLLYEIHPQAFDSGDVALMWLMSRIDEPALRSATQRLIRSFDVRRDHRPEVLYSIGAYYERVGDHANSIKSFKLLADLPGFSDEWYKIDACLRLGRQYVAAGQVALGREYIWRSAVQSRGAGFGAGYMRDLVSEMKADTAKAR
jgi:CubicO group peptidase (beta-lactamase class C family)